MPQTQSTFLITGMNKSFIDFQIAVKKHEEKSEKVRKKHGPNSRTYQAIRKNWKNSIQKLQSKNPERKNIRGVFQSEEKAKKAIRVHRVAISEAGYYSTLILEEVKDGIDSIPIKETWYQLNEKTGRYRQIKKPHCFQGTIAFYI